MSTVLPPAKVPIEVPSEPRDFAFPPLGRWVGLSYNGANVGLRCGTTLGLYQIQSSLGVGGMGEVYRATDTRLGRDVAIKVLPAEMARDADRLGRFRREAKALAQIDHPGIVTIYSVEECDGVHFLTMQLVDGEPLDRLIPKGGMTVERILEIGAALSDALAAAHEKGIVHRDLKPANVMVTNDGRVKVLDFGLAKDVGAKGENEGTLTSAGQTQDGIVMGTPSYMSPEQVSGRVLDHRTDIFSLGVLLHEMTVGTRPFEAPSSAELFSAILRDTPPAVSDLRDGVPVDLARVIRGCLEKDPRHRMQTTRDVSNAFREMLRGTGQTGALPVPVARAAPPVDSGVTRAQEGFWVAVLPFKYTGSNPDLAALAEGVTDDIVTNMSKFSYLRVVARSSTARYAEQTVDVRTAAKELGARYVMEGSIRQAGAKVRFAVQMVDANNGTGLWAETYDRAFTADSMLDVLDDVVPRIVATVGDARGILAHSMTESLRGRDPATLTPYEALLRSFGFHQHVTEEEQLAGVTALENAVKQAPDYADCWAMLSWLYRAEYTHKYNPRPDSMDRSLAAARRAVNLAPSSQLAHAALASAHFFRHELGEFRASAERALSLNRMQGYTTAFLGLHFAYSGDWERGCALAEHAIQLNPNHPGWYWMPMVVNAYRQHDGERALLYALRMNMPGLWTAQLELAVVYSQLGRMDQARGALRDLLALRPQFTATAREDLGIWWQPALIEQMISDLAKIGLTIAGSGTSTSSGVTPSIAVLPLVNLGADAEQDYFSDGLAEEIINLLAKIPGLKVIARTSSFAFRGKEQDVTKIAQALRVRNILEGSVRRDGNRIRITAQLIDAVDGAHRWSERYDREMDDVFEIQDEIGRAIAEALKLQLAPRVQAVNIEAWQHCLKGEYYRVKYTPGDLAKAKEHFEQAIAIDPGYAHAYARLAGYYYALAFVNMNRLRETAILAKASAEKALALDPGSIESQSLLGVLAAVVDHNWKAAADHHARALAQGNLWPASRYSYAMYYLLPLGRTAEAIEQSRLALENDPLSMMRHMGVAFALNFAKRYDESIEVCRRALEIEPNSYFMWHALGMAQFFAGRNEDAILSLRRTVELAPWYATAVGSLASACHRANDQVSAREWAQRLAQSEADSFAMAEYHATTGDADAMFKALEGAYAKRDVFLVFIKVWPTFDPYRADSRFQSLIKRMNVA